MDALVVEGLSKTYRTGGRMGTPALDKVSFNLQSRTITALLGLNGAGKTTLVRIALGLVFPTSGRCVFPELHGRPFRRVGYLPEAFRLVGPDTIYSFLRLMGTLSGLGRELPGRIREVVAAVGLGQDIHKRVKNLSKGMLQRVGVAQALLHQPSLLFLDEPTDGLDPMARIQMRELLISLAAQGRTVLITSHLLSEVELVADKVLILNKGSLLANGTPEELIGSKQGLDETKASLEEVFLRYVKE